jgi:predicted transglutaminase-like cysteine proteinase
MSPRDGQAHNLLLPNLRLAFRFAGRAMPLLLAVLFLTFGGCARKPALVKSPPPPPEVIQPVPHPAPGPSKLEIWGQLIREQRTAPIPQKVKSVNDFFNTFEFVEDRYLWGREDYWATLFETLAQSGGDCEDIAVAKYFTLSRLDIPEDRLRITYVVSLQTKKPHMVLTCDCASPSDPLVLDMVNPEVLPISRRSDLVPVYSFNRFGYWLARQEKGWQGAFLGRASKLSMWQDLLERMDTFDNRVVRR